MDKTERLPRPLSELVEALRRHIRLLQDYGDRAFKGMDQAYLGEVATKLRLLTSACGQNKPLLLMLMDECGIETTELRQHLAFPAYGSETVSRGHVQRTTAQIIRAWAEQHGAAHEDWKISEEFSGAFATSERGFYPSLAVLLHHVTLQVVAAAELVLAKATPEFIASIEQRRQHKGRP